MLQELKMCDIALIIILMHQNMSLSTIRLKKCVTNLLMLIVLQYNFFMNAAKTQKKCLIKQFILVPLYLIQPLIKIRFNRCVLSCFQKTFNAKILSRRIKDPKSVRQSVDVFLSALKFFLNCWL